MGDAVKTVEYTKAVSPSPASYMGTEYEGRVKAVMGKYEAASLGTGSTIKVGLLRKGETFITGWVIADDLSSAGTLALGDIKASDGSTVGDADRYLAATVFTTAGQVTQCTTEAGRMYTATEDMIVTLTTATEEMTGTIWVIYLKNCL
ncbi:MAG: hypothetical protein WC451_05855 [Patescibacteria group bacterium]|jgi:hypothetical protein